MKKGFSWSDIVGIFSGLVTLLLIIIGRILFEKEPMYFSLTIAIVCSVATICYTVVGIKILYRDPTKKLALMPALTFLAVVVLTIIDLFH